MNSNEWKIYPKPYYHELARFEPRATYQQLRHHKVNTKRFQLRPINQ